MTQRIQAWQDAAQLVSTASGHLEAGQPPVIVYLQHALPSREPGEPWPQRGVTIVGTIEDLASALEAQGVSCTTPWPPTPPPQHTLPEVVCRHQHMPSAFMYAVDGPAAPERHLWWLTLAGYARYRTELGLWRQTARAARAAWITRHPERAERLVRGWHDPSLIWSDGLAQHGAELLAGDDLARWPALAVALSIHRARHEPDLSAGHRFHLRVRQALSAGGWRSHVPTRPSSTRDPILHELFVWASLSSPAQAQALPQSDRDLLHWWSCEGFHLVGRRDHDIFTHTPRGSCAPCLDSLSLLAPEIAEGPCLGPQENAKHLLEEAEEEARKSKWILSREHEIRLSECLGQLGDIGDRSADAVLAEWMQGWRGGVRFGKKVGHMIAQWPTLSPALLVGLYSVLGRGEPELAPMNLLDRVPVDEVTPAFRDLVARQQPAIAPEG